MNALRPLLYGSAAAVALVAGTAVAQVDEAPDIEPPAEGLLLAPDGERATPRNYDADFGTAFSEFGDRNVQELEGMEVTNTLGEPIGEVEEFAIVGDRLVVIVGIGGFLNIGEHEVAIALQDLTWTGEALAVAFTEEELLALPEYDEGTSVTLAGERTLRESYEGAGAQAPGEPGVAEGEISTDEPGRTPGDGALTLEDAARDAPRDEAPAEADAADAQMAAEPDAGTPEGTETGDAQSAEAMDEAPAQADAADAQTAAETPEGAEARDAQATGGAPAGTDTTGAQMDEATGGADQQQAGQEATASGEDDTAPATEEIVSDEEGFAPADAQEDQVESRIAEDTELPEGGTEAEVEVGQPALSDEVETDTGRQAAGGEDITLIEPEIIAPEDDDARAADPAEAAPDEGDPWERRMNTALSGIADRPVSELEGMEVAGSDGGRIGEVELFARLDRQVVAIVGVGGFLGIGERKVAVPLEQISVDGNRLILTDLTEDQLRQMPRYDSVAAEMIEGDQTLRQSRGG